jgi:hypothetical protein
MPTVMCTRNLWRALGGRGQLGLREPGRSERGKLCVWSVRELFTRKMALAIGLEETTYLTVVFPLLELPDFSRSFAASVATALEATGVPRAVCEREAWAIIEHTRFAKNDNRSLLGLLNDVAFHADVLLESERRVNLAALEHVQAQLNRMPHVGREPAFPDQATRLLFASAASA